MGGTPKITVPPPTPLPPPPAVAPALPSGVSFNKRPGVGPASGTALGGTFMTGASGKASNLGLKTLTGQ